MQPETNSLNCRQTLLDRRNQQPAPLVLERVDGGEGPRPLDPTRMVRGLDRVGAMLGGVVGQFLQWTDDFRKHPFEIRPIDPARLALAQGDPTPPTTTPTGSSRPTRPS